MTPTEYARLSRGLDAIVADPELARAAVELARKHSPERARWSVFWAADATPGNSASHRDFYAAGLKDDHIDTALRRWWKGSPDIGAAKRS